MTEMANSNRQCIKHHVENQINVSQKEAKKGPCFLMAACWCLYLAFKGHIARYSTGSPANPTSCRNNSHERHHEAPEPHSSLWIWVSAEFKQSCRWKTKYVSAPAPPYSQNYTLSNLFCSPHLKTNTTGVPGQEKRAISAIIRWSMRLTRGGGGGGGGCWRSTCCSASQGYHPPSPQTHQKAQGSI